MLKDRGAIDRVDLEGPTAELINPLDNNQSANSGPIDRNPALPNLMLDPYFREVIERSQPRWRKVVATAADGADWATGSPPRRSRTWMPRARPTKRSSGRTCAATAASTSRLAEL